MRRTLVCVLVAAAVLAVGCGTGGDGDGTAATTKQFIARADKACARLPGDSPPAGTGTGSGRELLVSAIHRFVDAFTSAVDDLRQIALPAGGDRRRAEQFVGAMTRVSAAVRAYGPAIHRYRPADPTDTLAVARSFQGLDTVAARVRRLSALADNAAVGLGFGRCGHLGRPDVRGGTPNSPQVAVPAGLSDVRRRQFVRGRRVSAQAGCLACHRIGAAGNNGPGPDLSSIGERLPGPAIARVLRDPQAPMPSYGQLPRAALSDLVAFLAALRRR